MRNQNLLDEIFKYPDQVERIYSGLLLINTKMNGEPVIDSRFNIKAYSIEEKKREIVKLYSAKESR
jgi:hypothetical protein